jgi:hypothetical protein
MRIGRFIDYLNNNQYAKEEYMSTGLHCFSSRALLSVFLVISLTACAWAVEQNPTTFGAYPNTITVPGNVIYCTDLYSVVLDIKFTLNGGPEIEMLGALPINSNYCVQFPYTLESPRGAYVFTGVRNSARRDLPYLSVSAPVTLLSPSYPWCQNYCGQQYATCMGQIQEGCASMCLQSLAEALGPNWQYMCAMAPEYCQSYMSSCVTACVDYYTPIIAPQCQDAYDQCMDVCVYGY